MFPGSSPPFCQQAVLFLGYVHACEVCPPLSTHVSERAKASSPPHRSLVFPAISPGPSNFVSTQPQLPPCQHLQVLPRYARGDSLLGGAVTQRAGPARVHLPS